MTVLTRQELHRWIDSLPEAKLAKFMVDIAALQNTLNDQPTSATPYTPVKLGGLWAGVNIGDEQIAQTRREMWAKFGENAQ